MDEEIYESFNDLVNLLVNNYTSSTRNVAIHEIIISMRILYENKESFEYTFQRYYSDNRNPFTTAYSHFMNCIHSCMDTEESFLEVSTGILNRLIEEKITKNKYTVF